MSTTREDQIEELLKTPKLCQIRKLYRYRTMESRELEDIFTKRKIFLPRPIDFNDPFECRPKILAFGNRLKRQSFLRETVNKNSPLINRKTRKEKVRELDSILKSNPNIIENLYENFLKTTGMYCLSEKNDDILMWSHYSNGHRGLCIEFDAFLDAALSRMMLFGQALKVNYREERPQCNLMEIGEPTEYQKALLTKSNHWEYEQEWRIIKIEPEGGPGLRDFMPEILTGVVFGALISPEDTQKAMDWISKYPTKIVLYQAIINETKYQLDIEPVR